MSIVSSETIPSQIQSDGTRRITHFYTDHNGTVWEIKKNNIPGSWGTTEYDADRTASEAEVTNNLALKEVNTALKDAANGLTVDRVPEHQTQAEFDRRILGRSMLIKDIHTINQLYPFFQAVESRGGANANQRAAYLGVTIENYRLIENRFNDYAGIQFFVTDEKSQVWKSLPGEFS